MVPDRIQTKNLHPGKLFSAKKLNISSYWLVLLKWSIFFISIHSILLGLIIYFSTDAFYQFFFHAQPENSFFVRQSGVFLFIIGFFYWFPLKDINARHAIVAFIIFSKITAVLFLLTNARIAMSPQSIYLAAIGDGIMVIWLSIVYSACIIKKCL
jgi:hypothetical protein